MDLHAVKNFIYANKLKQKKEKGRGKCMKVYLFYYQMMHLV